VRHHHTVRKEIFRFLSFFRLAPTFHTIIKKSGNELYIRSEQITQVSSSREHVPGPSTPRTGNTSLGQPSTTTIGLEETCRFDCPGVRHDLFFHVHFLSRTRSRVSFLCVCVSRWLSQMPGWHMRNTQRRQAVFADRFPDEYNPGFCLCV